MKMHCKTCGCHFDDDFEETLEPECGMSQIQHLRAELQAVYDAYPWDHGKGEAASSLMKSAVTEASYQQHRFEARGALLDMHDHVVDAARIASYCISGGGTNSSPLFPELREAIQALDDLQEKQKKPTLLTSSSV